ncbi:MAG: flagellar motor switch protein FliM [Tepidisphaeraceae bacterium]
MADILDQSEVDALLAAVGGVTDSAPAASDAKADPFGAGFAILPGGRATEIEHSLYDFKRPERVSKDQMRALEALHEGFGRNFGASLSGYLRTIVEVSVAHLEQLTYSEFIHSLPNPTCFNLLKAEQLDGQICLEISPLIIYPIIDRLLGGSNADLFIPQRPLTQIEQRLVERITDRATTHLSEAWSALTPVTFTIQDFESNPQLVQIVPPNETVVVVGFELKLGNRAGTMSLCIPYNVIEPVMAKLTANTWLTYQRKGGQDDNGRRLRKHVDSADVKMRAVLARTTLRMSDLLGLQVGDIITTEKPVSGEVTLEVEGRNKFHGTIGQFRGNKAIRITRATRSAVETMQQVPAPVVEPPAPSPAPAKAGKR